MELAEDRDRWRALVSTVMNTLFHLHRQCERVDVLEHSVPSS